MRGPFHPPHLGRGEKRRSEKVGAHARPRGGAGCKPCAVWRSESRNCARGGREARGARARAPAPAPARTTARARATAPASRAAARARARAQAAAPASSSSASQSANHSPSRSTSLELEPEREPQPKPQPRGPPPPQTRTAALRDAAEGRAEGRRPAGKRGEPPEAPPTPPLPAQRHAAPSTRQRTMPPAKAGGAHPPPPRPHGPAGRLPRRLEQPRSATRPKAAPRAAQQPAGKRGHSEARSAEATPPIKKAPPHAGDRYRCSLPGLAGFTGQRWRDHKCTRHRRVSHSLADGQAMRGGEGGIRTLGTVAGTHDFQSCTFDHSVTPPGRPRRPRRPASPKGRRAGGRWGPTLSVSPTRPRGDATLDSSTCERTSRKRWPREAARSVRTGASSRGCGGERGIRTHGGVAPTFDFESNAFDRSASSPRRKLAPSPPLSTVSGG